ncbi:shikimate kinase [Marinococcus halotolerans]|uniref:shikimate kinase n=1 Tax=Marinococcus halotolerans TaxID=301092 RepID=UPI0003B472DF|nr:shikimate kinase [Marinococcus halotolerans]
MIMKEKSLREKSIVFIGFMGVGKTTIGRLVAQNLYRSFIDIDEQIEKEFQMPVPDVFKLIGEPAFRQKEKELVKKYANQSLKVISLGGGAFMQEEIRDVCLNNCTVFYLDMPWDAWKERIHLLMADRPVLQGRSLEDIEELFYSRQTAYASHHSKVTIDKDSPEEIADYITNSLKTAWKLYE